MKLREKIASLILPKQVTAQIALNKVTAPSKNLTDRKRVSHQLEKNYKFRFQIGLDALRMAEDYARDPEFPSRVHLLHIYERIMNDCHLWSQAENMDDKVTGSPYGIVTDSDEINTNLTDLFERNWFEDYMRYFCSEELWGTTLIEFQEFVKAVNKLVKWEVGAVDIFPREYVVPEKGWIVLNPTGWVKGIPYREEPWNTYIIEIGKANNLGKLLKAAPEVVIKNFSRTDWSQHSEKYGKPLLKVGTDTTDISELNKLEENAKNLGANGYWIGDKGDEASLMTDSGRGEPHKIYLENILYSDTSNSKLVTGQKGISDEQAWVGSAEAGERMLNERVEARMRRLQRHVNSVLIPKLIEFGYPAELANHKFKFLAFIGEKKEENKGDQDPNDPKQKDKEPGK